jgi:cell division protein FtsB
MAQTKEPRNAKKIRYVRLLNYDKACDLIDFIKSKNKYDYAYISTNCVVMQIAKKRIRIAKKFLDDQNLRFEITARRS